MSIITHDYLITLITIEFKIRWFWACVNMNRNDRDIKMKGNNDWLPWLPWKSWISIISDISFWYYLDYHDYLTIQWFLFYPNYRKVWSSCFDRHEVSLLPWLPWKPWYLVSYDDRKKEQTYYPHYPDQSWLQILLWGITLITMRAMIFGIMWLWVGGSNELPSLPWSIMTWCWC